MKTPNEALEAAAKLCADGGHDNLADDIRALMAPADTRPIRIQYCSPIVEVQVVAVDPTADDLYGTVDEQVKAAFNAAQDLVAYLLVTPSFVRMWLWLDRKDVSILTTLPTFAVFGMERDVVLRMGTSEISEHAKNWLRAMPHDATGVTVLSHELSPLMKRVAIVADDT